MGSVMVVTELGMGCASPIHPAPSSSSTQNREMTSTLAILVMDSLYNSLTSRTFLQTDTSFLTLATNPLDCSFSQSMRKQSTLVLILKSWMPTAMSTVAKQMKKMVLQGADRDELPLASSSMMQILCWNLKNPNTYAPKARRNSHSPTPRYFIMQISAYISTLQQQQGSLFSSGLQLRYLQKSMMNTTNTSTMKTITGIKQLTEVELEVEMVDTDMVFELERLRIGTERGGTLTYAKLTVFHPLKLNLLQYTPLISTGTYMYPPSSAITQASQYITGRDRTAEQVTDSFRPNDMNLTVSPSLRGQGNTELRHTLHYLSRGFISLMVPLKKYSTRINCS